MFMYIWASDMIARSDRDTDTDDVEFPHMHFSFVFWCV